jgi:hypothetical protein
MSGDRELAGTPPEDLWGPAGAYVAEVDRTTRLNEGLEDAMRSQLDRQRRTGLLPANADRATPGRIPASADLKALEVQVRGRRFTSDAERRRYVYASLEDHLKKTRGRVDPEERDLLFAHYEQVWRTQRDEEERARLAQLEAREIAAIESAMLEEEAKRRFGIDPRGNVMLTMHAAMGSVLEPFFPLIELVLNLMPGVGVLVAAFEALEGETLLTGQELEGVDRYLGIVLAALPFAVGVVRRGAQVTGMLVKEIVQASSGASVTEVYRVVRGLGNVEASGVAAASRAAKGGRLSAAERARAREALRRLTPAEHQVVRGGAGFSDSEIAEDIAEQTARREVPGGVHAGDEIDDGLRVADERGVLNAAKGSFGEARAEAYMGERGYVKRGSSMEPAGGGKPRPQGIDGVYENTSPPPKWVVIEAKYDKATYGMTKSGKQGSGKWVDKNLNQSVGRDLANQIRAEGFERWELRVMPDGQVIQSKIPWAMASPPAARDASVANEEVGTA